MEKQWESLESRHWLALEWLLIGWMQQSTWCRYDHVVHAKSPDARIYKWAHSWYEAGTGEGGGGGGRTLQPILPSGNIISRPFLGFHSPLAPENSILLHSKKADIARSTMKIYRAKRHRPTFPPLPPPLLSPSPLLPLPFLPLFSPPPPPLPSPPFFFCFFSLSWEVVYETCLVHDRSIYPYQLTSASIGMQPDDYLLNTTEHSKVSRRKVAQTANRYSRSSEQ